MASYYFPNTVPSAPLNILTMSHPLSNFSDDKDIIHEPITDTSNNDENFLKEFSIDFYQKIIDTDDTDDFSIFEDILIEWIKNIDKDTKSIFGLMQNHEQTKF